VNIVRCQPESSCFPRGLTTWSSPHMKAIYVVLTWSYSEMFIAWMFCFLEDNKIISAIENAITESDWKNKQIFNTLSVVRGCRTGGNFCWPVENLWSFLYIIYVWAIHRIVSLGQQVFVKHPNCLNTFT
jgi:hypothetical protein